MNAILETGASPDLPRTFQDRIVVVGSGWHFSSGISHYTYKLTVALAEDHHVGALLMRRLVPKGLYPGRKRVGADIGNPIYPHSVDLYDGVDWYWGRSLTNALKYLDSQRPTVVIFQWWTGAVLHTYLRLARYAVQRGAQVIMEWHEGQDVGESELLGTRRYVRTIMPRLLSLVDAHVVHSNFDLQAITSSYELRGAPVYMMPHGPYDHLVQSSEATVRPDPDAPFQLLYFGVVRPFKGVEDIVAAFNAFHPKDAEKFRLTIVGETWEGWDAPNRAIACSPYRDLIERVDRYVTDAELADFVSKADAIVLPYHRSSASGPLHIAMSVGLPVVVTAVGGLVEAVRDYGGALLTPPRDPEALRNALLQLPAQRGQRWADPHSWRRTLDGYDALIDELRHAAR